MNIIVDSCVLIAFFDLSDSNHEKAVHDFENYDSKHDLWLTPHILDEVSTILSKRGYKKQLEGLQKLIAQNHLKLIVPKESLNQQLIDKTLLLLINQSKTKASFTDLYSVAVIEHSEYKSENFQLLSYDHHLSQWSL